MRGDLCVCATLITSAEPETGLALGLPQIGEDLLERGDHFIPLGLAFPETQFEREVLVVGAVIERERFRAPGLGLRSRPTHFVTRGGLIVARDSLDESGHFLGVRLPNYL